MAGDAGGIGTILTGIVFNCASKQSLFVITIDSGSYPNPGIPSWRLMLYVRACVDTEIKNRAGVIPENMGLNSAGHLPFETKQPNQATADAMDELESGQGKQFDTTDALFNDLGIEQYGS